MYSKELFLTVGEGVVGYNISFICLSAELPGQSSGSLFDLQPLLYTEHLQR